MLEHGLAEFLNIFFTGLLAGFEIAVHYGIGVPPASLSATAQLLLRQALVRRLRILAPALFLPSLLLSVFIALEERHRPGSWLHYVAVAMLLVWAIIRIVRTIPVNTATLGWNPEAPPDDWRSLVQQTERFHVVAAWAAVLAFQSSLASSFRL